MKTKTKIILFSIILFTFLIIAPASYAESLELQQPFGELKDQIEVSGITLGQYIAAAYGFGTAVVSALAIVMITIGGVQWIMSGGSPDKIGQAKDRIVKAFLGLFIALFSVFILQIVSPATINLASLNPTSVETVNCCELPTGIYFAEPEECTELNGNIVEDTQKCIDFAVGPPPMATDICTGLVKKADCEGNNRCEWTSTTAQCSAKNLSLTGVCWINNDDSGTKDICRANKLDNCIWVPTDTCLPVPKTTDKEMSKTCTTPENINNKAKCELAGGGDKCKYYTNGACDNQTSQNALKCSDFKDGDNCPIAHCSWWPITGWSWLTGSGICGEIGSWGSSCTNSDSCGNGFCCTDAKCNKGVEPPKGEGVCIPKITPGGCCGGLSIELTDGDNACTTDRCSAIGDCLPLIQGPECCFMCV